MKTIKLNMVLSLLVLISALPNQAFAKKKVSLKYKLQQNDKFVSKTNVDQDIEMQAQGQTIDLNQVITIDGTTLISQVKPNSIETTHTINRMTMKQSIYGQEMTYDSSDPTTFASGRGKQVGEALNKLIGKSYQITIDEEGNITGFNLDSLMGPDNKVSSNVSTSNNFIVYPDHKVGVGDSWEADIKPLKNGNMKIHMKYTLKKMGGGKAVIGLEGNITANKVEGAELNLSGTQSGEATVDLHTGWTMDMTLDQEVKIEVQRGGMTIPMHVSGTISKTSRKK